MITTISKQAKHEISQRATSEVDPVTVDDWQQLEALHIFLFKFCQSDQKPERFTGKLPANFNELMSTVEYFLEDEASETMLTNELAEAILRWAQQARQFCLYHDESPEKLNEEVVHILMASYAYGLLHHQVTGEVP